MFAEEGLQSWGRGCRGGVAELGWGLQGNGRKVWVVVANRLGNAIVTSFLQRQLCNPQPYFATLALQPLSILCDHCLATPTRSLQFRFCKLHPNLKTLILQPLQVCCYHSDTTSTGFMIPLLNHLRARARKAKNLKVGFTCKHQC